MTADWQCQSQKMKTKVTSFQANRGPKLISSRSPYSKSQNLQSQTIELNLLNPGTRPLTLELRVSNPDAEALAQVRNSIRLGRFPVGGLQDTMFVPAIPPTMSNGNHYLVAAVANKIHVSLDVLRNKLAVSQRKRKTPKRLKKNPRFDIDKEYADLLGKPLLLDLGEGSKEYRVQRAELILDEILPEEVSTGTPIQVNHVAETVPEKTTATGFTSDKTNPIKRPRKSSKDESSPAGFTPDQTSSIKRPRQNTEEPTRTTFQPDKTTPIKRPRRNTTEKAAPGEITPAKSRRRKVDSENSPPQKCPQKPTETEKSLVFRTRRGIVLIPEVKIEMIALSDITIKKVLARTAKSNTSLSSRQDMNAVPKVLARTAESNSSSVRHDKKAVPKVFARTTVSNPTAMRQDKKAIPKVLARRRTTESNPSSVRQSRNDIPKVLARTAESNPNLSSVLQNMKAIPKVSARTTQSNPSSVRQDVSAVPKVLAGTESNPSSMRHDDQKTIPKVLARTTQSNPSLVGKDQRVIPKVGKTDDDDDDQDILNINIDESDEFIF